MTILKMVLNHRIPSVLFLLVVFAALPCAYASGPCDCEATWHVDEAYGESYMDGFATDSKYPDCSCSPSARQLKYGSLSGSQGSYSLSCTVETEYDCEHYKQLIESYGYPGGIAAGWKMRTLDWSTTDPDGDHGACSNASFSYSATCYTTFAGVWNAENQDASDGTGYSFLEGYAEGVISGVENDSFKLGLRASVTEGASEVAISYIYGFSGPIGVTNGVFALTTQNGSAHISGTASPAAVGQSIRVQGLVTGSVFIRSYAEEASISTATMVSDIGFQKIFGGTSGGCDDGPSHEH